MSATSPLRRLAVLLLVLPPLLSWSLARGVVLCIAADGHLAVEAIASACCDDPGGTGAGPGVGLGVGLTLTSSDADCGPCADYGLEAAPEGAAVERVSVPEPPVLAAGTRDGQRGAPVQAGVLPALGGDRGLASPHLVLQRTVLLRC
jgi:hypothetical protein